MGKNPQKLKEQELLLVVKPLLAAEAVDPENLGEPMTKKKDVV